MMDRTKVTLSLQLDRRRILLVEKNSQLISAITALLFRAGAWDVWQAHNCARARELWATHADQIDVAVVDVGLADGNGLDLLKELSFDKPQLFGLIMSGRPIAEPHSVRFLLKP